jgi:hypothetical protein
MELSLTKASASSVTHHALNVLEPMTANAQPVPMDSYSHSHHVSTLADQVNTRTPPISLAMPAMLHALNAVMLPLVLPAQKANHFKDQPAKQPATQDTTTQMENAKNANKDAVPAPQLLLALPAKMDSNYRKEFASLDAMMVAT